MGPKLDRKAVEKLLSATRTWALRAKARALAVVWNAWRELKKPKSDWHWASIMLLLVVAFAYTVTWFKGFDDALFDPNLQTDDARTAIFPFHRYAEGAPLANDPIANEMIEYQPYAFRLLYRITVPFVGVLVATKIVQGLCLLIVVAAGLPLLLSRRAGLGTACLFVFLFLHDMFVTGRIGGGLPRGFGFPAIALWLAGTLAHSPWTRRAGAIVAALTYPSAMAMILGAEGIYALRNAGRQPWRTTARRLLNYGALVAVCAALLAPAVFLGASDGGPVHTLEQAEQEPAFSKAGRLWLLPLGDPGRIFGEHLLHPFRPRGAPLWPDLNLQVDARADEVALAIVAVLAVLPLLGLSPVPASVIAFLVASLVLYVLSVKYAFRLYSPERYYSYGMRVVGLGLAASTLGLLFPRLPLHVRQPIRNVAAALTILLAWMFLGDGARVSRGRVMEMTIDYRRRAPLWEFIKTLPQDVRIASHIRDGDDIPLFAQRANNGGFETLQPWLTKSWARQKARAEDTLRAFYATDRNEVLAYAKKYAVTHLLVNSDRYKRDFVKKAQSFEPLSTFARELLRDRRLEDLVLRDIPEEAVIHRHGSLLLVDVQRLARAWESEDRE